jgi:tetratricopeptide (TPR) repeat protein
LKNEIRKRHRSFALVLAAAVVAGLASDVQAQEELKEDRTIEQRREATQSMDELVYKRLSAVHEDLGEDRLDEALKGLATLEKMNLNDYELALVHQTYLPNLAQQGMLYSLAGLYAANQKFLKAIETMRVWFQYEANPPAKAYMVIGSSYAELKKYDEALPYIQKAIEVSEEPEENWYLLELSIYFEKNRFRDAVRVVRTMLEFWPDKVKYWEILLGAYLELGDQKAALDAMMVAYARGLIDTEALIKPVVQLNMALEVPYTAASILEREIAAGNVEASKENLDILLQAWLGAREFEKAVATIDRLAPLSDDGQYYMRKAGILNELGDWQGVIDAATQAFEAGLDEPAKAHILVGIANSELGRFQRSVEAFRRARQAGDQSDRRAADAWIDFIEEKMLIASAASGG